MMQKMILLVLSLSFSALVFGGPIYHHSNSKTDLPTMHERYSVYNDMQTIQLRIKKLIRQSCRSEQLFKLGAKKRHCLSLLPRLQPPIGHKPKPRPHPHNKPNEVPEPSSIWLLACGLFSLGLIRYNKPQS